jgi:hypothetical protein
MSAIGKLLEAWGIKKLLDKLLGRNKNDRS